MLFEAALRNTLRVWLLLFCGLAWVFASQPVLASSSTPPQDAGASSPDVQLWEFNNATSLFRDGPSLTLNVTMKDGQQKLWNPVSGNFTPMFKDDYKHFDFDASLGPEVPKKLSNGNTVELLIKATTARCGYTIGSSFTYAETNQLPTRFYIIERYEHIQKTFYCGTPLRQKYDSITGLSAAALSDGRVLILLLNVGGPLKPKNFVIAFRHVPSNIMALGKFLILVPASYLQPGLNAALDNQGARYRALLATLKNNLATTTINSELVQ